MKSLACGMALTLFLQLIQSKIDLLIISDRLCLSALIFCTVSAIGKSHIGTSLFSTAHPHIHLIGEKNWQASLQRPLLANDCFFFVR